MTGISRRVVMTGAAGLIGTTVTPYLDQRWDLHLTDLKSGRATGLDITDGDACRAAFADADAVIHLAADPNPDASWEALLAPNVVGAYQVAQAARDCGVRRLVLASSLQAMLGYPEHMQVRAEDPPRPANLYGATKAWIEALGAWVANTSSTSVVALRIGYFAVRPPAGDGTTPRDLAAWLSPRDCSELLRAAVEAEVAGFVVANGVSANRYRKAEPGDSSGRLGYRPSDDAWSEL
ncbi:MAG: NAD(P)-dependent oxidoreductase [Actinomycetota bacterium]|nr:NAD(P)-dependent oxidoreductase [Actinomycetota bacterium]